MQEFTLFRVSLLREFTVIGIVLIKPVLMAGPKLLLTVFGIHFRWEIIGPVSVSAREQNSFVVQLCLRAPKKNMTTIFAPIAVAPNPNFKERLRASEAGNITDKCHGNEIPWERVKATSEANTIDRVDVCSQGDDFFLPSSL